MEPKTKRNLSIGGGVAVALLSATTLLLNKPPGVGLNPALVGSHSHYRQIPGGAEKISATPFNAAAGDPWHGTKWPNKFTNDLTTFQNRYGVPLSEISSYVCGPSNETLSRLATALKKACLEDPARIGSSGNYDCEPFSVEVFDATTLGPKFGACNPGFGWSLVTWAEASTPPPPVPVCGDHKCEQGETVANCPADCATTPPPPVIVCGDGKCEGSETALSCPDDCGSPCPPETPCPAKCIDRQIRLRTARPLAGGPAWLSLTTAQRDFLSITNNMVQVYPACPGT